MQPNDLPVADNPVKKPWQTPRCTSKDWQTPRFVSLGLGDTRSPSGSGNEKSSGGDNTYS